MRHAKFTAKLEEAIADPAKLGIKLRADNVDIAYPPIVQSGGVYDLRASAQSDDRHLQYDVITASIGAAWHRFRVEHRVLKWHIERRRVRPAHVRAERRPPPAVGRHHRVRRCGPVVRAGKRHNEVCIGRRGHLSTCALCALLLAE